MVNQEHDVKIFVVDDEPDIRNLLSIVISSNNYETFATSSIRETLYKLSKMDQRSKYIFVVDYRLTDGNGIQLIYALAERNIDCTVILISAGADPSLHEHLNDCENTNCIRDNCTPFKIFLAKPFTNEILMEVIKKYV